MKNKTTVIVQFSKPAVNVLLTARRKGMKVDLESYTDVYDIPFTIALTQKEIADGLSMFRHNNNLTMARIIPGSGEFSEMDSTNMSHAGAYYFATVEVWEDEGYFDADGDVYIHTRKENRNKSLDNLRFRGKIQT